MVLSKKAVKIQRIYVFMMSDRISVSETVSSINSIAAPRVHVFICIILVVRPMVDFRKSFQPERDMDKLCIFEPTCAYCTVGSYASLSVLPSVRLSVRPSVTG